MITKRILKNTLMLYVRQIVLLLISLYTVRVVLDVLGVEDFGVYSVITGIVTICSFLSGSMATSTQRYFSYAIGNDSNCNDRLKYTFSVSLIIYLIICCLVLVILEGPGLWFVINKLNLPEGKIDSAIYLYHYSVITFCFTIMTAPFIAIIISHEDMHYFACISLLEGIVKLFSVYALIYIPGEKLEVYGTLQLCTTFSILIVYLVLCKKKYSECQFKKWYWDFSLFKEMFTFTSWTMFGQLSTAARIQAVTILINQYFNPTVVAARAIAITISSKVNIFSNNFNTGLYPVIIKNWASGKREEMYDLIINGSKLTFFLMWILVLPLLFKMESILSFWLTEVPSHAVFYTKLALIEALILSISMPLTTAARAPGKMKTYELTLGTMQIMILVIAYIFLENGYLAYSVFIIAIVMNVVMFFVRLFIVSSLIGLPKKLFIKKACTPMVYFIIITYSFSLLISKIIPEGIAFDIVFVFLTMLACIPVMFYTCIDKEWQDAIINYVRKKFLGKKLERSL
ncbi:lipopolysaccharide biosynthesis protein [Photobacterium damselae]